MFAKISFWALIFTAPISIASNAYAIDDLDVIEETAPEAEVSSKQLDLTIKVGASEFTIPAPSNAELENFADLDPAERLEFLENREQFLMAAARSFGVIKHGFGIGSLVKEKIVYAIHKVKESNLDREMENAPETTRQDYLAAKERSLAEQLVAEDKAARLTLRERSELVITSVLRALDKNLWNQAKVFAHANEYGIMASAGVEAIAGGNTKGWGGLFDIGISIGYNRDTKALVIQIFRDYEKFLSTPMKGVFLAGLVGKAGMYVANKTTGETMHDGTTFYPPMIPGFASTADGAFWSGFSSGLTWPPPPLSDLMTYTNTLEHNAVLRISVSPALRGFIRIESGLGQDLMRFFVGPLNRALRFVKDLAYPAQTCRAIFAN